MSMKYLVVMAQLTLVVACSDSSFEGNTTRVQKSRSDNAAAIVVNPDRPVDSDDALPGLDAPASPAPMQPAPSVQEPSPNFELLATPAFYKVTKGVDVEITLGSNHPGGAGASFALLANPEKGEVRSFNANTGVLVYRALANQFGSDRLRFKVKAGAADSEAIISFEILNRAPVVLPAALSGLKGVGGQIKIAAQDADGDVITYYATKIPDGVETYDLDQKSGSLSIKPKANFVGTLNFEMVVADTQASSQPVTMSYTVLDNSTDTLEMALATWKNKPLAFDLLGVSGPMADAKPNFAIKEEPAEGKISAFDPSTGSLTFTPNRNFVGEAIFTYTVALGLKVGLGTVRITVANSTPSFVSTPISDFKYYLDPGDTVVLEATVRDFKRYKREGVLVPGGHPDFENGDHWGDLLPIFGVVQDTLGPDGKPRLTGRKLENNRPPIITSADTFAQWYQDVPGVNHTIKVPFELRREGEVYKGGSNTFFPIDGKGFAATAASDGDCTDVHKHNCHFTTEFETSFRYQGNEEFTFSGDDDFWLFINGKLAVDLGGKHPPALGKVKLKDNEAALGITVGKEYSFKIFHAERAAPGSTFTMETTLALRSNAKYEYRPQAVDADGDSVTFALLEGPAGMVIDPATGALSWSPKVNDLGTHSVRIKVSDSTGAFSVQAFQLVVR